MGFKSFFILGAQFFLHLLGKLAFWRQPPGAKQFLANYAPDDIAPTTPSEGEQLEHWLRCTNCGLCEAVCPVGSEALEPGGSTFADLAQAGWRDLTAHKLLANAAQKLVDCGSCAACEAICPERIPLTDLAKAVARAG